MSVSISLGSFLCPTNPIRTAVRSKRLLGSLDSFIERLGTGPLGEWAGAVVQRKWRENGVASFMITEARRENGASPNGSSVHSQGLPGWICLRSRFQPGQRLDRHSRPLRYVCECQTSGFARLFELLNISAQHEVKRRCI